MHGFSVCTTDDRKGVCHATLPFLLELLGGFLGGPFCAPPPPQLARRPRHILIGCDNAPPWPHTSGGAASVTCSRLASDGSVWPHDHATIWDQHWSSIFTWDRGAVAAVMVLKEPRLVSEKFYGRKSWPLRGSKPLVVDSFGSGGPQFAPRLEQLAIPWGALTYASRGLSPAELYIPATVDRASASISESNTAATGSSDADRLGLRRGHCAFMGRSDGARGAWGDFIPPGYKYRGALIRALNCTRLLPGDRNAIHIPRSEGAGRGGGGGGGYAINYPPMQFGPFEGTRRHYAGYRYVLAVENTDEGSPVSEKMVNAFLADATPIVWGGGAHKDVFNPASYVDCSAATQAI